MNSLMRKVAETMPSYNKQVCEGFAMHQLKNIVPWMETVIRASSKFHPDGMEFVGCEICTPQEQFNALCNLSGDRKGLYEMAPSTVFMIRVNFRLHGQDLTPRYILLPYARRGGVMQFRSTNVMASPVVSDPMFSVENRNIFMQILCSRDNFFAKNVKFLANGNSIRADSPHCRLFRTRNNPVPNMEPMLSTYLFSYHGVEETFKRYFNTKVHTGDASMIHSDKYPADKWVVCSATPGNVSRGRQRESELCTGWRIAVERKKFEKVDGVRALVAGFFYSLDNLADKGFTTAVPNGETLNNKLLWRRCLVRFCFKECEPEQKYMETIETHLDTTLPRYIDPLTQDMMDLLDIKAKGMLELLAWLCDNFSRLTAQANPANVLGKTLEINRYLMIDVTAQLFHLAYDLQALTGRRLTVKAVEHRMNVKFPVDTILNCVKHGEVSNLETATDNMLQKVTLPVVTQGRATGRSTSNKAAEMTDPAFALDPTMFYAFTVLAINKSMPSGRGKATPYINLDRRNRILPIEEIRDDVENLDLLLNTPVRYDSVEETEE